MVYKNKGVKVKESNVLKLKVLLGSVLLSTGLTFGEYVSVVDSDGHVLTVWVGNGYELTNVNKTNPVYITSLTSSGMRYGSHSSGVYLKGDWQYRGYIGSLGGVSTGMFVRVR